MKSPYRALIWEQARTAGVLCCVLCGLSFLSVMVAHILFFLNALSPSDARDLGKDLLVPLSGIAAGVFVVRQDVRGHIVLGFEPRLFRLPVSANMLFSIVLSARLAALVVLLGLQLMLLMTLPDIAMTEFWRQLSFPIYLYLAAQALAWSIQRAPVLLYGLLALAGAMAFTGRLVGASPDQLAKLFIQVLLHPGTLMLLPPLMVLIMYVGVYLERQDGQFGPRSLSELMERVLPVGSPTPKKPRSPLEAQLWYETRRMGMLLPLATAMFTLFFVFLFILLEDHPLSSGFGQYVPLAALVCAAIGAGVKGMYPRSRMPVQRPLDNAALTTARMLAQLRGLLLAMAVAGLLSLLLLLAGPVERQVLLGFLDEGPILGFDLFIVIMRPLMLAGMVSWVALWLLTGPVAMVVVALTGFAGILFLAYQIYPLDPYAYWHSLVYGSIGIVLALTLTMTAYMRLRRLMSIYHVAGLLVPLGLLTSFLYFGSRALEGVPGLLFACACAALLVTPAISLTWSITGRRHEVSWRRFRL